MLIRSQAKLSLMYLCNFPQSGLEVTVGFILYAAIFDEASEMMFAISAGLPTEVINITVESIRAGSLETEAEKFLYFCPEGIETHAINRILQASILSAAPTFQWHAEQVIGKSSLSPVAVVPLHKHDFLGDHYTLFYCHEA
jgi:hypothetical protein